MTRRDCGCRAPAPGGRLHEEDGRVFCAACIPGIQRAERPAGAGAPPADLPPCACPGPSKREEVTDSEEEQLALFPVPLDPVDVNRSGGLPPSPLRALELQIAYVGKRMAQALQEAQRFEREYDREDPELLQRFRAAQKEHGALLLEWWRLAW